MDLDHSGFSRFPLLIAKVTSDEDIKRVDDVELGETESCRSLILLEDVGRLQVDGGSAEIGGVGAVQ